MVRRSRFRDTKNYGEKLQERTEAASGARGGKWKPIFLNTVKFEKWICREGDHVIDIIPYIDRNDNIKYKLEVLVHQRVGPDEGNYICPKTFNSSDKCGLCDARVAAQTLGDEELAEALRPRDRVIYNIVCYDSDKEEDKGVQIWEASSYLSEENFQAAAKERKKGGGGKKIAFADPDNGRTISFERIGTRKKTTYKGFSMDERDEPISDEILDDAYILEDLIDIPTEDVLGALGEMILSGIGQSMEVLDPASEERPSRRSRMQERLDEGTGDDVPIRGKGDGEEPEERPARKPRRRPTTRRRSREEEPEESPARRPTTRRRAKKEEDLPF